MILNHPKRACIYFIYDRDGIIDEYVISQLKDLRENVAFLHCVINGKLTVDGQEALSAIADEVYVRENKGNDIGAYKAAIKKIGWEQLSAYDELVIVNNTCFGPVYPFREAFDWAAQKNVDFWGLTIDNKSDWMGTKDYLHYNKCKFCIQSYFLVLRKPLLGSELLQKFYDEIPEDTNYIASGSYYEYAFPGYFEERGYKWAVYCDTDDLNYPLLHDPVKLLREYRMPLFKKRSFFHHYTDVLNNTAGEATIKLIRYLENETDYDMDQVWSAVLRTSSLSDLVRCAQLNRVLSDDFAYAQPESRVGVVFHAYYEDLFDETIGYLKNFPAGTDFLLTTSSEEKKALLEQKAREAGLSYQVLVLENRGRDVSALLVGAAEFVFQYDLICFAHDKKTTQIKPQSLGRSWSYKLNENMFGSAAYVANVIHTFESEPRLGIAFPAYPNHGPYAYTIGTGWAGNYPNAKKLLDQFELKVKTNEHTLCVAPLGTCFWFRPQALKKLFGGLHGKGWSYRDFPAEPNRMDQTILHAIERAYAYFAQDAGFYPAYLYNAGYAAIELTNLEFNKTGSTEMRAWCDALVMQAIGLRDDEGKTAEEIAASVMQQYDQNVNYGVKQSLIHVAFALRCKYPKAWSMLLPVRRMGQKMLRIKTK